MTIIEIYPAAHGSAPIERVATAPRDVANSTLLLLYCSLSVAEICVAIAAVLVSVVHYSIYHKCLLSYMPNGAHGPPTCTSRVVAVQAVAHQVHHAGVPPTCMRLHGTQSVRNHLGCVCERGIEEPTVCMAVVGCTGPGVCWGMGLNGFLLNGVNMHTTGR